MNDVEVILQQVNYANGHGLEMGLRHQNAGLEPFIVRQWEFKENPAIQSLEAITCLCKGMADTLGTDMIRLAPVDRTHIQLDEDTTK